jgi:hypothetical protein
MAPITKARRRYKFTVSEIEHLLETVEDVIPIGNPDWERIWQEHSARYPTLERTADSLKRKFQELARKKVPTGDPNCPPYIRDEISRVTVSDLRSSRSKHGNEPSSFLHGA